MSKLHSCDIISVLSFAKDMLMVLELWLCPFNRVWEKLLPARVNIFTWEFAVEVVQIRARLKKNFPDRSGLALSLLSIFRHLTTC